MLPLCFILRQSDRQELRAKRRVLNICFVVTSLLRSSPHCTLSASIGSTEAARIAGTNPAASAEIPNTTTAVPNTIGS